MEPRRLARECAVQMLFQIDLGRQAPDEVFGPYWEGRAAGPEVKEMAERLVRGTRGRLGEIDELIRATSEHWRIERMPAVDRSVLRLAIYEFLYETETPKVVIIDEAIDLAKKFGGEESGQFVNGVLDAVRKKLAPTP